MANLPDGANSIGEVLRFWADEGGGDIVEGIRRESQWGRLSAQNADMQPCTSVPSSCAAPSVEARRTESKRVSLPKRPSHRRKAVHWAQALHTASEQLVYQFLWNRGESQSDASRTVSASYRDLVLATGRDRRTI